MKELLLKVSSRSYSAGVTAAAPGKVKPLMARLGMTLFFGAFLAMGLLFLVLMGKDLIKTVATYSWKETPAKILASSVTEAKKGNEPFSVAVRFHYQWKGRSYTSDRYETSPETESDYAKAYGKIANLSEGTLTHCYVDPQDPGNAVLRRKSLGTAFFLLLPLVFIAVGGGMIAKTWLPGSKRSRLLSSETTSQKQRWGTLLGGVLFTLVGVGALTLWFLPALNRSLASSKWTETPCTVISSRVKSHKDSDGTTYSVDIFYRYQVNGKDFKSNAYGHFGGSSSGYKAKAKVVAQYPAGARRVCFVNPRNPSEAVLKPGVGWEVLLGLLPLVFLGVGIFLLFASRKTSAEAQVLTAESLVLQSGGTEARPLKSKSPPLARFVGILLFVLVWNGVVAVFLWDVVDGFRSGSPDWFLTLFLTPFVAIGLGSIGFAIYSALALTNPRCRLKVTPAVLKPGDKPEVTWSLTGAAHRVQRLRIVLEGREEAVYRRGTSTYTDRHTFARFAVAEVSSSLEMSQGQARFGVPDGVPPSFQAPNNKIIWTFRVHGEIARWPDVLEEFEVVMTTGKP